MSGNVLRLISFTFTTLTRCLMRLVIWWNRQCSTASIVAGKSSFTQAGVKSQREDTLECIETLAGGLRTRNSYYGIRGYSRCEIAIRKL